jgi:hypothetical protein
LVYNGEIKLALQQYTPGGHPILDDDVLKRAVTEMFMRDLKANLMREAEGTVDATVEKLGANIEIMVQAYLKNSLDSYLPEYLVHATVKDKRENNGTKIRN